MKGEVELNEYLKQDETTETSVKTTDEDKIDTMISILSSVKEIVEGLRDLGTKSEKEPETDKETETSSESDSTESEKTSETETESEKEKKEE